MNILVTGADGFIGGYLTKKLIQEGHHVFIHTITDGDIAKKNALEDYKDKAIQHVFHLGARTFVPQSFEKTHEYFNTNIMGTITALEFCRQYNCSITFMSTYVYGTPEYLPVDEKHSVKAMTPYHQSKITCEGICEYYAKAFGIKCVILRPFNVYGKGQNEQFLIPTILQQLLDEKIDKIKVMDLEPKRDYIYVKDLVRAMIMSINPIKDIAVYNVGSGESISVEDLIITIESAAHIKKRYASTHRKRKNEVLDCTADISAIQKDFGFNIEYSLVEGIKAMLINE